MNLRFYRTGQQIRNCHRVRNQIRGHSVYGGGIERIPAEKGHRFALRGYCAVKKQSTAVGVFSTEFYIMLYYDNVFSLLCQLFE